MAPKTTNLRYITWKTGINPSPATRYNMEALNPTQRVELTSARIFGHKIGSGLKSSGFQMMKKDSQRYETLLERYSLPLLKSEVPEYEDYDRRLQRLEKKERYLRRIIMKGVKIGVKKGGGKTSTKDMYRIAMMRKFGIDEE
mmetsp:Transcript_45622/g.52541  ORF Transcript_45622/g.52541 Transcript_45622/m.52541 type:complete len:142 (+) Transcript_45622:49-474(+)|eukprot:CAMPEP_0115010460 /NCGR_PEP_ID=MMETSP0216-20121206/23332_1 /TAXON_ID=223996 /ORGANISM="Protocruzia adherens, Strain Boccale" /LENGTH=141 /DNA_ID=CAMNT_0002378685 /DNA_START=27 /DNA_END=452 /DNA_ORIENTATION=-